jgi:cysteine synthase A
VSYNVVIPSALDLIGNTPLLALDRIHLAPGRILAKAEFMQPGGSIKDRAARAILFAARADGRLTPGAPVVEMTSGNMGAGLAVACAALGIRLWSQCPRGTARSVSGCSKH